MLTVIIFYLYKHGAGGAKKSNKIHFLHGTNF